MYLIDDIYPLTEMGEKKQHCYWINEKKLQFLALIELVFCYNEVIGRSTKLVLCLTVKCCVIRVNCF